MASPMVVGLLFSTHQRDWHVWQGIFESILPQIDTLARRDNAHDAIQTRLLDRPSTTQNTGQIAEITSPVPKAITLRECKAITDNAWFQEFQAENQLEIILQPQELYLLHKTPGLAVFDMDSTLIQQEVIDELARAVGLYDQVAAITEAAMRGEEPYTDFEASLRARVALLKGVPMSIWDTMKADVISFTPGAPELIRALRSLGWKTAVLSGGFAPLANWVKDELGLDYAFANHLVSNPQLYQLTGELVPEAPIIHGQKKKDLLLQLAKENGIPPDRVVAVGDGSNDLPMMDAAGLGIAFNAKPKVQLAAPAKLNRTSLIDVLYVLGYSKEHIENAISSDA